MKSVTRNFLKHLLLFSLIIVLIAIGFSYAFPKKFLSLALPYLFPFFIATTWLSFYLLVKAFQQRFIRFANTFMLLTAVKLVLYVVIIVSYIFINQFDAIVFAINFFILYLCFTIFEVVAILKYSKTVSASKSSSSNSQ